MPSYRLPLAKWRIWCRDMLGNSGQRRIINCKCISSAAQGAAQEPDLGEDKVEIFVDQGDIEVEETLIIRGVDITETKVAWQAGAAVDGV